MNFEILKNEKNIVSVKLHIDKDAFEAAVEKSYQKNKGRFRVNGFRPGKAPRRLIEQTYGKGIFFEDALDIAFPDAYTAMLAEANIAAVATPVLTEVLDLGLEDGATITIDVAVEPTVACPEYKDIEIPKLKYTPKKAEVEEELNSRREKNARMITVEDQPAQMGDMATIDFEGFVDGVAFEGGKSEDYPIELGSHTFIDTFEDQIAGHVVGDNFDVNVKFPEEYHSDALKGKDATFKVSLKQIQRKELPELDDELAIDFGFDSLDDLTKDAKKVIKERKEAELKAEAENKIIDTLIERTQIDIPEQYLKEMTKEKKDQFEATVKTQYGIDANTYYSYMLAMSDDKDPAQFDRQFEAEATKDITVSAILRAVVEDAKLEATEAELKDAKEKLAQSLGKTVEELGEYGVAADEYAKNQALTAKVYDYLLANAVQAK